MTGWLDGKVVVCTGGGSGIGRAAVEAFVPSRARPSGCWNWTRPSVTHLAELGPDVLALPGDATSVDANAGLVADALDRWGRIDAAATFVGVFDHYLPLTDIPADQFDAAFDEIFDVNVRSASGHGPRRAALAPGGPRQSDPDALQLELLSGPGRHLVRRFEVRPSGCRHPAGP